MTVRGAARGKLKYIRDETEYYPHQVEGVRIMARMNSFLLADEMGLGKSIQALTVAAIDFEWDVAKRIIVVCPSSLKWNWEDEVAAHSLFTCMVLDGTPKKREAQLKEFVSKGIDILIVNYEQVQKHLDDLNYIGFDIGIFDEAHMMKNPSAKRTKACLDLKLRRSFVLTGSPVLNRVNELWPILHRIDPEEFPRYWSFVNRYARFGGFKGKEIVGVRHRHELNALLAGYMIRRLKTDVLDLPEKQYITEIVQLAPEQAKLYREATEHFKMSLPDGDLDPLDVENALTRALRLKQVCGTTYAIDPALGDHSVKLDRAMELIEEIVANGKPVVVFTQFRGVQEALANRCAALKPHPIPVYQLHGDVPKQHRAQIVKDWGDHPGGAAMIAMLQVAGVGLNMTQASTAIFLDKLWVPKLNAQAEDRIHRIGADATQPIQIIHLLCKGTVEYRVEQILKRKSKLFDSIVEDADWKRALLEAMREDEEDS